MITTLDDFGLSRNVNREIDRWTRIKKVNFVSLLTNTNYTDDALRLYRKNKEKKYALGLHFNIIEGKPLSNVNKVKSIVDQRGYFYSLPVFILRLFFGLIKKDDIMYELQMQYDVFTRSRTHCIHINSHQNVHVFHFIYRCVEEFSKKKNIRFIRQAPTVRNRLKKFPLKYILFNILYFISSLLFSPYSYKSTSFFENTFHPGTTYDL